MRPTWCSLTLSSTGRRVFERMKNAFDTVLIDEAAQASEVAVLQPLSFGCKRCASTRYVSSLNGNQHFIISKMFPHRTA